MNVVTVVAPPLRERTDDIPLLAEHFLAKHAEQDGLARKTVHETALHLLAGQSWLGSCQLRKGRYILLLFPQGKPINIKY